MFQHIANKPFADICTAAFIAQNIAERRIARMELATIIEGGVAACAENADNARLVSAKSSRSPKHITLYANASSRAEGLPQGLRNNGSLFGRAACTIEIDGLNRVDGCAEHGAKFMSEYGGYICLRLVERVDALRSDGDASVAVNEQPCCFGRAAIGNECHHGWG